MVIPPQLLSRSPFLACSTLRRLQSISSVSVNKIRSHPNTAHLNYTLRPGVICVAALLVSFWFACSAAWLAEARRDRKCSRHDSGLVLVPVFILHAQTTWSVVRKSARRTMWKPRYMVWYSHKLQD